MLWRCYKAGLLVLAVAVAFNLFVLLTWGMGAAPLFAAAFAGMAVLLGLLFAALATAVVTLIALLRWVALAIWKLARRPARAAEA